MKKYIFMVLALIMLAGAATFFCFNISKIEIKRIERVLTEAEALSLNEGYYLENINLNIELSKKVNNLDYFMVKNDFTKESFICEAKFLEGSKYEIQFDNLYFNNVKYLIVGYSANNQEEKFKKNLYIEITDPYPIKISSFFVNEMVEVNDLTIQIDLKLYNPLKIEIIEIKYQINEDVKVVLKEDIIFNRQSKTEFEDLIIQIENGISNMAKVELLSFIIKHNDIVHEVIIQEDFSENINVYKEVEIVDLIVPEYVYLESKDFLVEILMKENNERVIYGFTVLVNDIIHQVEVEERKIIDDYIKYKIYVPNTKNLEGLEVTLVNIVYNDEFYKIFNVTETIEVKRALDGCVLKTKSSTVMLETKHTFYLECTYIDDKINLYKFNGKFNGEDFEGANYISYPKEEQNKQDFGYIDVRNNIISLITLPVVKLNNQPYCSLEITEIVYFYDNQESVYTLNDVLWVIPEETVVIIKSFSLTQDTYKLPNEVPTVKIELLASPSIMIDKIIIDVNGQKIESTFKDGGTKTQAGTILFNCLAYKPSSDKDFVVRISSIEYVGQGTRKSIKGFLDEVLYSL